MSRYAQVVRAVTETPWAILPEKLATIVELIAARAEGERLSHEEIRERIGAGPPQRSPYASSGGAVAVLPLYGVIIPRASLFSDMSGGTSVQGFSEAFRAALADKAVASILIDVDSPGGQVDLVPELAEEIRGARGVKPIVAVANTLAASAAYWIASQADEVYVTPSGEVGSIGVFSAHTDLSEAQTKEGIKTTLISAGKYKVELSPFEPLSKEARAALQERIDAIYNLFVAAVAQGRGISTKQVREGFGEGRVVSAKQALEEGMVDYVGTFEEALGGLGLPAAGGTASTAIGQDGDRRSSGSSFRGESFKEQVEIAHRVLSELEAGARTLRVLTTAKREQIQSVIGACDGLERLLAEAHAEQTDDTPPSEPNVLDDALEVESGIARQLARLRL